MSATLITVTSASAGRSMSLLTTRTFAPASTAPGAASCPSKLAPTIHKKRQPAVTLRESFTTSVTSTSTLPLTHSYSKFFNKSLHFIWITSFPYSIITLSTLVLRIPYTLLIFKYCTDMSVYNVTIQNQCHLVKLIGSL